MKSSLSIGIFTYSVKPRGSVVHAACLAEALADEGARVTLYALAKGGDAFFRPLRVPLVTFPAGPAPVEPDALIEQRVGELQAGLASVRGRHDIYHAEDCLTASALVGAPSAGLLPVVRTVHHVERYASPYLAACQRRSIEKSDLVLSVSARTSREVALEFGRASAVVHNGVDVERFRARPGVPAVAAECGILADDVLVLSVGGVEVRKNTLRVLEAVAAAMAENQRIRWLVVGGASIWDHGELERRFDERVRRLPRAIRHRIHRTGPVAEGALTWLYRRSDVLLCPSLHEGWGLCALEALAAGTAVIASEREPFTEFLDRDVALLVDPESTRDITYALATLAADGDHRADLGRAGRRRAREFTWQRAARAHLTAYGALIAERRAAPPRDATISSGA